MENTQSLNWNDPNLYLFLIGYSIMFIPLFKRELLIQKKSFTIIIIVSAIMFITALLADLLVDFIFFNK